ncbi:MAG: hypothetical protein IJ836_02040 [Spirochaetales bacterium]|nr:hypothetical protein [Spirochaetales bacterium]
MDFDILEHSYLFQGSSASEIEKILREIPYTVSIPHNMTKWAMMMNVSRPSLYREIKRLESKV